MLVLLQVPASVVQVVDYLPTLTGLVLIPLICSPLDTLTHKLLDVTYRPATTVRRRLPTPLSLSGLLLLACPAD